MVRRISFVVVGAGVATFAAPMFACSGPGAPTTIARNIGIGFACFSIAALIAIPVTALRLRRRGLSVRALFPLLGVILHPAWTIRGTADCGMARAQMSYVLTGIWIAMLVYEGLRFFTTRHQERHKFGGVGYGLLGALLVASVGTWFLPWTLDPQPIQYGYVRWSVLDEMATDQKLYRDKHGVYASSGKQLFGGQYGGNTRFEEWQGNGDLFDHSVDDYSYGHNARMLQGTVRDPLAWRVDGGLSDWAVIARPFGIPEDCEWMQLLFLSDGSVWGKPDPGTGEYLLDGLPDDLAADGWREVSSSGDIRRQDFDR